MSVPTHMRAAVLVAPGRFSYPRGGLPKDATIPSVATTP
jgi:hypothetical protein